MRLKASLVKNARLKKRLADTDLIAAKARVDPRAAQRSVGHAGLP